MDTKIILPERRCKNLRQIAPSINELRIAPPAAERHNIDVPAEQMIALEAAITELSTLYAAARTFAPLRAQAESELLPQLLGLGRTLRHRLRAAELSQADVDAAARQILDLRETWRARLEQVRVSAVYQDAQRALANDRQSDLKRLVPLIFAGMAAVRPVPTLFFPVSPSSGQRRPGSSPFLSATECARRIAQTREAGIAAEESDGEWWDRDWPCIVCADDPGALDTPIALRVENTDVGAAVFAVSDDPMLRLFTLRLRAPMSVVLAADASDEWWQAYEDSYQAFRAALQSALAQVGITVRD